MLLRLVRMPKLLGVGSCWEHWTPCGLFGNGSEGEEAATRGLAAKHSDWAGSRRPHADLKEHVRAA